jgi:membrane peptidoglycan carboxypeptidase
MVQNAAAYDPLVHFEAAKARQAVVVSLMVQNNAITQAEADAALNDELQFASSPFQIRAPHAVMLALQELEQRYPQQLYNGGLDVTLTINVNWTEQAQSIVNKQLDLLNNPPPDTRQPANANNAALIAIDPYTGEILTMLGSPDYFNANIDGALNATLAFRQPGSTLKPFTYALAMNPTLSDPYTPATMLLDVQTPFVTRRLESYSPGNYGLVEHGTVSLREALASSYNIPAVATLDRIGIEPFLALLANAGIRDLAQGGEVDLSVTLGGGEVRLLDLAQAYGVFANGGWRVEPVLIQRVVTHEGDELFEYEAPRLTTRVLDERVAYLISDILSDNNARQPAFGINNPLQIGRPAAAKTGTTTDYRDNWVMGYTPNLVVGVWVGNADNSPMVDISGITGAGPIWNLFLREVTNGTPVTNFPRPEGLVTESVCIPSGLLPTPQCPLVRQELFIDGTQPTQTDNLYQTFVIDRRTRTLATDETPIAERIEQVFLVLPQEAQEWGRQNGIAQPPTMASVVTTDSQPVRLLEPDPYTTFEISDVIPLSAQRLRLTVATPANTMSVTYELNGQDIGSATSSPWLVWWTLTEGDYTLIAEATLQDGTTIESEGVPFRVVRDEDSLNTP